MASSDTRDAGERTEIHNTSQTGSTDFSSDVMNSLSSISKPVEMSDLSSTSAAATSNQDPQAETAQSAAMPAATEVPTQPSQPSIPPLTKATDSNEISPAVGEAAISSPKDDESAIGPATERPHDAMPADTQSGPQLNITLLLHSTDTRHPYIINQKYLQRRNVTVADNDPTNLTVYNLKDLIWRDWRNDWDTRPAAPSSIRLIHMGRMLEDKAHLRDMKFTTGSAPHVVHMSIRPQEAIDDEDARIAKGSTRDGDETERRSGCRCLVM